MDSVQYILHGSETTRKELIELPVLFFAHILDLIRHVIGNINSADKFLLVIPGDCLEQLFNDIVYNFSQTWQIYVYYEDVNQMERDEDHFTKSNAKLRFCHKRNLKTLLEKFQVDTATRSPGLNYEVTVNNSASSWELRLSAKRPNSGTGYSPVPKRINQNDSTDKNDAIVRDVYITQVNQSTLRESAYTAESAEHILPTIPFVSTSVHLQDTSSTMNDQKQPLSVRLAERIRALSAHINNVSNQQQRITTGLQDIDTSLEILDRNLASIQTTHQDNLNRAVAIKSTQDRRIQKIRSLKQTASGASSTSHDNSYIWKITNIREKIVDAQSGRQKSIYSPPFYSSSNGYKLRLRLYLNGDADTRDEHLSLFIVVMKGESDVVLGWPFSFHVIFRLINQSKSGGNQGDIIRCLRPDVTSHCFRRPIVDMNEAFGIKCFVSIEDFEKNQRFFIKDDIMLIEAKIDLMNESAWITPSAGGLPNDEEHVEGIEEECMQSNSLSNALFI